MALTLTELVGIANNYTDENITVSMGADFYNEAIAKINTTLSTELPYIDKTAGDYSTSVTITGALSDTWQRSVVVPYMCYSIKTNDGSMNEAAFAYQQRFENELKKLKLQRKMAIDINYRISWKECSINDYTNATITEDIDVGTNLPSSSYLSTVVRDLAKVVKIYNNSGVTKYFRLTEQSSASRISPIGSSNYGWFSK